MPDIATHAEVPPPLLARPGLPQLVLFAVSYFAAAWLGQFLTLLPQTSTLLWLPNGLCVAMLLHCERSAWSRLITCAAMAGLAADMLLFGLSLPIGLALSVGNGLETLTAAWLIQRVCGATYMFHNLRDILALILLAAGIAPLGGALIGTLTFLAAGFAPFSPTWMLWWMHDAVGMLIVTPPMLVFLHGRTKFRELVRTRWPESLALIITLVAVAIFVLSSRLPVFPLLLPVLLWAALRFGMPGTAFSMAIVAAISLHCTGIGSGPFAAEEISNTTRVLLLHAFLGVCAVSTLVLAALVQQRHADIFSLRRARDELEQRVVQGTEALRTSDARFIDIAATVPGVVYQWIERVDGSFGFTYTSERFSEYFQGDPQRIDEIVASVHPDDLAPFMASREIAKKNLTPWEFEGRFLRDGEVRWWRAMSRPFPQPNGDILFNGVLFDVTEQIRTAQILADALDRFRALTAMSSDSYWEQDAEFRFTQVQAHGPFSVAKPIGKTRWEIPTFGVSEDQWAAHRATLASGKPFRDFEFGRILEDGTRAWISANGDPRIGPDGRVIGYFGISRDITARRASEVAMRTSEARFRDIAINMPGVVYQWVERADGSFGFTYASPRIQEYFDVTPDRADEMLKQIHPDDVAPFRASVEASKKDLSPWRFEGRFRDAKDGSVRWWRAMSRPALSENGDILYNGVLFDVTAEKEAAEALDKSVQQLRASLLEQRALLAASPAGFGTLDENRMITSANDAMLQMFGCSAEKFIGRSSRDFFVSEEQWTAFGREGYEEISRTGTVRAEVEYRRPDGSTFWGLVQGVQIDPADSKKGRIFSIVDITEQKTTQRELETLSRELECRVQERTTALSASEARLRAMLDLSSDWYWEQDSQYRYTKMEGHSAQVSEYGPASFLGLTRWELPVTGITEAQWAEHRATLDARRPFRNFVHQFRKPDGSIKTINAHGEPMFDQNGLFKGYRGIGSDISELTRLASLIRQRDERLQVVLAMSDHWYWEQDVQHRFTLLDGLSAIEPTWDNAFFMGKARWELPIKLTGENTWDSHRKDLDARKPFANLLISSYTADGRKLIASVSGKPRFDAQGRFVGYHGTSRDVTETERIHATLRESQERLALALKSSRLTFFDWDITSGQVVLDEGWAEIIGDPRTHSDVHITQLQALLHPDDALNVLAVQRATLKGELPEYDVEHRVRTASGAWKWIHSHGMVTRRNAEGRALRMTGTNADIDQRKMTEEQVSSLLRELKAVLAASPAGIFTVDSKRRIVLANAAMEKMFGYSPGGMLGMPTRDISVSAETWQWIETEGFHEIRERSILSREVEYLRKDGSRFWGLLQGVQIDPLRSEMDLMFVVTDIDEFRQAKESLRKSEARLQALLDLSVDWYWEQDEQFRFTRIQGPASPLRTVDPAQIIGKALWEIGALGVSEDQWAAHRGLQQDRQTFNGLVYRLPDGTGKEMVLSISGEPVFGEEGRFTGYRGIGRDMTELEKAAAALRESEHMLSLITDNVPAMIAYFDSGLVCRFANPGFTRAVGALRREVINRHLHGILGEENYDAVRGYFARALAGEPTRFAQQVEIAQGGTRIFSVNLVPDINVKGRISGCYALFEDITEQKATERKIRQMNAELELRVEERTRRLIAANRELEAFSYSVSHDLQAPLRRIQRYTELLTERTATTLDEASRAMLESILKATGHTRELIGDLMKLSQISRAELNLASVSVTNLAIAGFADLAKLDPARQVSVQIHPDIQIEGDASLLRILLDNLLGNAWKFTSGTEAPRIEIAPIESGEGRGFYVRDNGAGFDMRYGYKLFGSFQRLHGQDEFKGTGIGLAIVQRIVNLHGWKIAAQGEVGKGATFTVRVA
ncbi:MAG: PAS domain S-box protein [Burkholderiales bacterium]